MYASQISSALTLWWNSKILGLLRFVLPKFVWRWKNEKKISNLEISKISKVDFWDLRFEIFFFFVWSGCYQNSYSGPPQGAPQDAKKNINKQWRRWKRTLKDILLKYCYLNVALLYDEISSKRHKTSLFYDIYLKFHYIIMLWHLLDIS